MVKNEHYAIENLGQSRSQELHRDRIAQVYFGETSDSETQRRARDRINWTLAQVKGAKVYDIGCSEGITAVKLAEKGFSVDAIDINPEVVSYARKLAEDIAPDVLDNLTFSVTDIFSLDNIQPIYDSIVLGEVIEHVFEPGNLIKRAILALKTGGRIIITTPWGYFPAPDHHQTFFFQNFLNVIPAELCCEHLSVSDGFIRYVGVKFHDPLDNKPNHRTKNNVDLSSQALLDKTEKAALEAQTSLRQILNGRQELLEQARARAVTLNADKNNLRVQLGRQRDELAKLQRYIQVLQSQKLRLAMERSLFPQITYKLRHIRRTLKAEGFQGAMGTYSNVIVRKLLHQPLAARLINKLPTQFKYDLRAFISRRSSQLDSEAVEALRSAALLEFVIICNRFPGQDQGYGGEFIRSRFDAYLAAGKKGSILHLSRENLKNKIETYSGSDSKILRLSTDHIKPISELLSQGSAQIFAHSPLPVVQNALQENVEHTRLNYWFHGFDVRDYRRLYFNFNTEDMAREKSKLDEIFHWRKRVNQVSFVSTEIKKIFVSNFIKSVAEYDNAAVLNNAHIIPNYIDGMNYAYQRKSESDFKKVLLIRSFEKRNYANDIAINAIKMLAKRTGFEDISFTICGFGEEFSGLTSSIAHFPNVSIQEGYSNPSNMAALHKQHGIFLCPSRFDTQGVTMGEAMASGLVCITNDVAGIPEFIDNKSGILVQADNPRAFAESIWHATHNPAAMLEISQNAAKRVRNQCSAEATIHKELNIALPARA